MNSHSTNEKAAGTATSDRPAFYHYQLHELQLPDANTPKKQRATAHDPNLPPHSIEAEQAVIGGLLLDAAAWDNVADVCKAEDFYRPDHQLIFEAIGTLATGGKPCDIVTVSGQLERSGKLQEAGGFAYIGKLARDTPKAANVKAYAAIVRERAQLRRLQSVGPNIEQAIAEGATALQIAQSLRPVLDTFAETAAEKPTVQMMIGFTAADILGPIEAERLLLPGVPAEAYTLIAGALSSYKTTLMLYLLVWKATGWDVLGLDQGHGCEVGKSVVVTYEDTDRRIFAKLQRVIQHGYALILNQFGKADATHFVELVAANLKRITLAGKAGSGIVCRLGSNFIVPNNLFLAQFFRELKEFAPEGALIGINPLRLAIVGSQNDDDGADVVVQTLNRIATEVPGSGIIVASHATKNGAQEGVEGYASAAYATSGSALYSQHARSNFHLGRLKGDEIRDLFDPNDVTAEEAQRQSVVKLTHGRNSHGLERDASYLLMGKGTLSRVEPRTAKSASDVMRAAAAPIFAAIDRIKSTGIRVSADALEADEVLRKAAGGVKKIREGVALLQQNGYIEFTGKTRDRDTSVTVAGRAFVSVENRGETSEESH